MDRRIDRQTPDDPTTSRGITQGRQEDPLLSAPHQDLTDGLKLGELAEDQQDGLLDASIRILLDAVAAGLHIADRHGEEELTAARLLLHRLDRALPKDRQLHLAHRALHAEQEPVIGRGRVIDAVLVDDQRANQAAELQKGVPVAPVARQPGSLQRKHGADAALADRGQKPFKAGPPCARARPTKVIVDHRNVGPSQLTRSPGQTILPPLAL